jgi:hypothetical protein
MLMKFEVSGHLAVMTKLTLTLVYLDLNGSLTICNGVSAPGEKPSSFSSCVLSGPRACTVTVEILAGSSTHSHGSADGVSRYSSHSFAPGLTLPSIDCRKQRHRRHLRVQNDSLAPHSNSVLPCSGPVVPPNYKSTGSNTMQISSDNIISI